MQIFVIFFVFAFHASLYEMSQSDLFTNKIILAPMVRMNTLPFRLLALEQGADLVFSEEIIDHKILRCDRKYNELFDTIDYIDKTDGTVVFQTCAKEKGKIIFQIGTSSPERAAKVASIVQHDVAGIDINMGCPKHFSISGGMGAALLHNRTNAQNIIKEIKKVVNIPVTCKIRILDNLEETISFCKLMQETGVTAISIHGRKPKERPHEPNRDFMIKEVARELSIPVIANGGSNYIENYKDIFKFKEDTNCTSVMIARAAQYNCSIFNKKPKLSLDEIIIRYLKYAVDYNNCFSNTKYCVQSMLRELQDTPRGKLFLESNTLEQICEIWGLEDYCRKKTELYRLEKINLQHGVILENQRKKFKTDHNDTFTLYCLFFRSTYDREADLPKSILLSFAQRKRKPTPKYETRNIEKLFQATVLFDGKKYSSSHWVKNKRNAEQEAAMACLCFLKIYNEKELRSKGLVVSEEQ